MYKEFQKEQFNRDTIEVDNGFVTYNYYPEDHSLYIHIIYVKPEHRNEDISYNLELALIEKYSPKEIYCYVDFSSENPELSLIAILKRKYKICSSNNEKMILRKILR